jgi:myo-inositol-1(or 4)-monophosphatase
MTPHALAALAQEAAEAAGALIRENRPERVQVADTKSSPTDVVTEMDRAAERCIRDVLLGARPADGLLGEETGLTPGSTGLTWVVDPIDGTINYLYGIPAYAVSVAVVEGDPRIPGGWTSLAGCVLDVGSGEIWTASRGGGAWVDGRPVAGPAPPELGLALIGTGFGYREDRRRSQARVVAALLPRVRDVRRFGSAALDLCWVAGGRLDGFYERGVNSWDIAAGILVAAEAGVDVRGLRGAPPGPAMLVAARPPLADVLVEELEGLGADSDDARP